MIVQCAHGDVVTYPLARVELEMEGRALTVEAEVSDTLPQLVLLGTNVKDLSELLKAERRGKALLVVTRGQARKEISSNSVQMESPSDGSSEPEKEPEKEPEATESSGQSDVWQMEYNFDDYMFVGNESSKEKKSSSQKRKDCYKHAKQKVMAGDLTLDVSREEFRKLQDEDPAIVSLKKRKPQLLAEHNGLWYHL